MFLSKRSNASRHSVATLHLVYCLVNCTTVCQHHQKDFGNFCLPYRDFLVNWVNKDFSFIVQCRWDILRICKNKTSLQARTKLPQYMEDRKKTCLNSYKNVLSVTMILCQLNMVTFLMALGVFTIQKLFMNNLLSSSTWHPADILLPNSIVAEYCQKYYLYAKNRKCWCGQLRLWELRVT